jgi:trehalose 6-phosphate synthase
MLLPMLLRTLISGGATQGEITRRELSRVAVGVPTEITASMGIKPARKSSMTAMTGPSSPTVMSPTVGTVGAGEDEGVADVGGPRNAEGMTEEEEEAEHERREEGFRIARERADKAARDNGKEGVKIGFFLHTPFPSSEIYRWVRRGRWGPLAGGSGCGAS